MTAKSIIDIEVRDQAFKDFAALFAKYQKQVENVPKGWDKVGAAVKNAHTPFTKVSAAIKSTVDLLKEAHTAQEKFKLSAQLTGKAFGGMATGAGKLAKSIKGMTLDLLKWGTLTGVFSGLLGAGGLFGMDRLARAASTSRREAQGLGISPGEHEAAKINYQKLVDVDSMLARINDAKLDVTKRSAFSAAGLKPGDWENQNAADILKTLIPQMKTRFEEVGGTKQGAEASGLTQFTDMETLLRLKAVTREEIDATAQRYEADKKLLAVSDEVQRKWQDLGIQLQRSGSMIENSFIKGLAPLAPHIERLSAAVAGAVDVFLASPKIGEWIDKVGTGLERFANYLTSDDLDHDIKSFLDAVDTFAGSLWGVAKAIGKVFNFGNEQGLKASQYRQLEQLDKADHKLAQTLERVMKNPEASGKFSAWSLSTPTADLAKAMEDATPEARMLAKSLQENTKATAAQTIVATDQRVKSQINLANVHADKSNLKLESARQLAEAMQAKYGVPAAVTMAQFQLESGNGKHMPAGSNNPFGIKARAGQPYVEAETTEFINGVETRISQKFAKFDSMADAFDARAKLLATSPRYASAQQYRDDPKAYAAEIAKSYATDPAYARKLQATIDQLARTGSSGGTTADSTSASYGAAAAPAPAQQRQQAPAPIQVNITKAAGADVNVQVLALSGVPG